MKIYPPVKSNNKSQVQIQKSQIFNCQVQIHFQSWESHEIMSGNKYSNVFIECLTPYTKVECVFPVVIWPGFRMGQFREAGHRKDATHFNISVYISMKDRSSVVLIGLILFLGESKIALGTFARNSIEIFSEIFF